MRLAKILTAIAVSLALAACGTPQERAAEPAGRGEAGFYRSLATPGAELDAVSARDMISEYRRNHGLSDLALDADLQQLAQQMAREAAHEAKLGPNTGALRRKLSTTRIAGTGATVNLTAGYHTLAEAFSGWRQSPPHNAQMLSATGRRMGVAAVYQPAAKYRVYWVLIVAE